MIKQINLRAWASINVARQRVEDRMLLFRNLLLSRGSDALSYLSSLSLK